MILALNDCTFGGVGRATQHPKEKITVKFTATLIIALIASLIIGHITDVETAKRLIIASFGAVAFAAVLAAVLKTAKGGK